MIRILTILLLFSVNCFATDYFVSFSTGDDGNSGLNSGNAWKTLAKVNGFSFAANDRIFLMRGDTWNEPLIVPRNSLTINAYGSGAKPIISGAATLTSPVRTGLNKWRYSVPYGKSHLNLVTIGGVPKMFAMDSAGWKRYTAVDTNKIIYPHAGSWLGKIIVIKPAEWVIEKVLVTADNGSQITFQRMFDLVNGSAAPLTQTKSNYGFFLSNDTSYLDVQDEIVWRDATKHLYIYSTTTPSNVVTTNLDTLVDVGGRQNVTIKNLRLRYGGLYGIYATLANNLLVDSCDTEYFGAQSFGAYRLANSTISNNTVDQCLQTGIYIQSVSSPYINVSVINNSVTNVGLIYGQGSFNQNPDYSGMGVSAFTGLICQGNYVDNVGDAGIKSQGNNELVRYNNVTRFCQKTTDRAAYYNFLEINVVTDTSFNKVWEYNFASNGYGDLTGTPQQNSTSPENRCAGFYMDGRNEGDTLRFNVTWNVPGGGFSLNIDSFVYCYGNLNVLWDSISRYRNATGVRIQQLRNYPIKFFSYTNNTNYVFLSTQKQLKYTAASQSPASIIGNFKAIGTIDNNYYNMATIANYQTEAGTPFGYGNYNHSQFVSTFGFGSQDIQLPNYPYAQCLFLKNWSPNNNTTALTTFIGKSYINAQGTIYRDSIRLQPNTAQLLFPTVLTPIVVTIDSNPVITLPVNSTTISGIATGGTITSYLWRKKTGGAATITSPSNRVTGITGLVAGTYTFTLVATNSLGQTDSSFATVTVNPAPPPANVPPVVTITPNTLQITLPTNTVTLNGSATDSDGTITGYQWVLVSGTGGTITSPTNDTTTITGLTAGTYIYSLTATDNVGATGSATVQVQVNPQAVISSYPKLRIKP